MRLELRLRLPADARLLTPTRHVLADYLNELGADREATDDVVLALDEACTNVIRHAFPTGAEGSIDLRAAVDDEAIVLEVEDDGMGFDVERLGPIGERGMPLSGRGLHLIHQVMSKVELESPTATGGTRLRMARQLDRPGSAAAPAT